MARERTAPQRRADQIREVVLEQLRKESADKPGITDVAVALDHLLLCVRKSGIAPVTREQVRRALGKLCEERLAVRKRGGYQAVTP